MKSLHDVLDVYNILKNIGPYLDNMQPYPSFYYRQPYAFSHYTYQDGCDLSYSETILPTAAGGYYPQPLAMPGVAVSYSQSGAGSLPYPVLDYPNFSTAAPQNTSVGWQEFATTPAVVPDPGFPGPRAEEIVNKHLSGSSTQQDSFSTDQAILSGSSNVLYTTKVTKVKTKSYMDIRDECSSKKYLWEDSDFPATSASINPREQPMRPIEWKRPYELCKNPKFVDEQGMSRFDVMQGELGDCWLLAAIANLTLYQELIQRVVPSNPVQSFDRGEYFGAFRFFFWCYGDWTEVVVDDRLPTYNGRLVYMHSAAKNEFWSALLEKAYAKLVGCYDNLKGGSTCESMTDLTGGFCEVYELKEKAPKSLLSIVIKACERESLMCCSINLKANMALESRLPNGLIVGHAYSVTDVKKVILKSGTAYLIRIRNPWGQSEWNGAFSDSSPQWQEISEKERKRLGLVFESDGEFWMTFQDFVNNYDVLEICNLSLDLVGGTNELPELGLKMTGTVQVHSASKCFKRAHRWETTIIQGEWKRRFNAGGCRNYLQTFWTNPQYRIKLSEVDEHDPEKLCTVLVGLMQKDRRLQKKSLPSFLTVGFSIYKLSSADCSKPLDQNFFAQNVSKARSTFINLREVSGRFRLPPGTYCIIPCTYEPETEGEYVLRIYSEKQCNANEMDDTTKYEKIVGLADDRQPASQELQMQAAQTFNVAAGGDGVVDALELQAILSTSLCHGMKSGAFAVDSARSMIALKDADMSGDLSKSEFIELWCELYKWKLVFLRYDVSRSGTMDSINLRDALKDIGFGLSNKVFKALVLRYSDRKGKMTFDDFISCAVRLATMLNKYQSYQSGGKASFSLEDFMMTTMYC